MFTLTISLFGILPILPVVHQLVRPGQWSAEQVENKQTHTWASGYERHTGTLQAAICRRFFFLLMQTSPFSILCADELFLQSCSSWWKFYIWCRERGERLPACLPACLIDSSRYTQRFENSALVARFAWHETWTWKFGRRVYDDETHEKNSLERRKLEKTRWAVHFGLKQDIFVPFWPLGAFLRKIRPKICFKFFLVGPKRRGKSAICIAGPLLLSFRPYPGALSRQTWRTIWQFNHQLVFPKGNLAGVKRPTQKVWSGHAWKETGSQTFLTWRWHFDFFLAVCCGPFKDGLKIEDQPLRFHLETWNLLAILWHLSVMRRPTKKKHPMSHLWKIQEVCHFVEMGHCNFQGSIKNSKKKKNPQSQSDLATPKLVIEPIVSRRPQKKKRNHAWKNPAFGCILSTLYSSNVGTLCIFNEDDVGEQNIKNCFDFFGNDSRDIAEPSRAILLLNSAEQNEMEMFPPPMKHCASLNRLSFIAEEKKCAGSWGTLLLPFGVRLNNIQLDPLGIN